MARYTYADLRSAVAHVNLHLTKVGSPYTYECESRNGYYAVDLYKDGNCRYSIGTGTAKECWGSLYSHAFDYMSEAARGLADKATV